MSIREQFPILDPAQSTSSTRMEAVDYATTTENEALHLTTALSSSSTTPAQQTPPDIPIAQAPRPSPLIATIAANAGPSIAVLAGAIGLSAVLEDPSSLPRLSELGNGLIGLACAGCIVVAVVALDSATEGVGAGVEEAWGRMWRWVGDRVRGQEGEVEDETRMLDEGGDGSVLYQDQDQDQDQQPGTLLDQTTPMRALRQEQSHGLHLPSFTFPPSSEGGSEEYSRPRQRVDRHPLSSHIYADTQHASGLLGPSPLPPRSSVQPAWTNFTGQGFHRHEQRLKAVSLWATPGRRGRTFDEVLREVEESDDAGRRGAEEEM